MKRDIRIMAIQIEKKSNRVRGTSKIASMKKDKISYKMI